MNDSNRSRPHSNYSLPSSVVEYGKNERGNKQMDVAKLRRDIITDTVFGWALRIEAFVIVILLISAEFIFGYTTSSSDAVFTLLISFLSLWLSRLFFNMAKRLKGEVGNAITKHEQSN